jgi:hypothetical protein
LRKQIASKGFVETRRSPISFGFASQPSRQTIGTAVNATYMTAEAAAYPPPVVAHDLFGRGMRGQRVTFGAGRFFLQSSGPVSWTMLRRRSLPRW